MKIKGKKVGKQLRQELGKDSDNTRFNATWKTVKRYKTCLSTKTNLSQLKNAILLKAEVESQKECYVNTLKSTATTLNFMCYVW